MAIDVVAGGPDDYMEVGHLVLRGSQRDIGEQLARMALHRHGVGPAVGGDPLVTRARRRWYQREWPAHYERMRGVAGVHGVDVEDDSVELGLLAYLGGAPACSVAWLPATASGHPTLSRNYDFPTGTLTEMLGGEAQPGELPMTARPYVLQTDPSDGPACLFLCAYELLGGCIDGVNSHGLVVALLADDETTDRDPTLAPAVGLNEIQLLRYLLETCASVAEAREAVLAARYSYMFLPCHFLVADAGGDSFVYERTANADHLVEGAGAVQVVTNHLLHGRPSLDDLPAGDGPSSTYERARRLTGCSRRPSVADARGDQGRALLRAPGGPGVGLPHAVARPLRRRGPEPGGVLLPWRGPAFAVPTVRPGQMITRPQMMSTSSAPRPRWAVTQQGTLAQWRHGRPSGNPPPGSATR